MRRLAVAGVLLASCTLSAATLAAAQENPGHDEPAKSGNWFTRTFSWGGKPETKKTDANKGEPAAAADPSATVLAREGATLNRRNEVILKIREIAIRTHDDALLRKADELDERADMLYRQRTGGVALEESGGPSARPLPKGPASESRDPGGKR